MVFKEISKEVREQNSKNCTDGLKNTRFPNEGEAIPIV